ncbi:RND transporter [Desulfonema ishimotonii]|uniref:RND transporter n=1 Tax=Desulfonema ishimotonii TaxID=45657 RepID=A0A401G318_9BACT|nr:efflux transporter outer membrane subunit [Desulfonema ishimotonii]GBC63638.1 RND transporter [Desulfonema ishimotonii]
MMRKDLKISTHHSRKVGNRTGRLCLALFLMIGLLQGCTLVGPSYRTPETQMPDIWQQELARGLDKGEADLQTWWKAFNDPVLDSLIARAADGNLDLKGAFARIREARARVGVASGEQYPDLNGGGQTDRSRTSDGLRSPGQSSTGNFYSVGLDSSWEIDFWGRISRSVESAQAGLQASVEDYRDVLVLLYAEIARNYVEVRKLQARLKYAQANAKAQRQTLRVTKDRFRAEIAPALDVHQAELNLASTESLIPSLKIALVQSINRLGVLLGEYPSALHEELGKIVAIPKPPKQVLVGLPANLMRQRPDIRSAERQLASQTARIGVTTAELYPAFSLSGTFGLQSTSSSDLFESGGRYWSFGPQFRWNLFSGGRIRNQIRVEEALTEQALVAYEQAVLNAVEDVENSMVAYVQEEERRKSLARSVTAARKSVKLVSQLYKIGLTDFQNLLDMERSLFQQQDSLAESEGNVTQNLIALYKSLGGGWGEQGLADAEAAKTEPTLGEKAKTYWNKGLDTLKVE